MYFLVTSGGESNNGHVERVEDAPTLNEMITRRAKESNKAHHEKNNDYLFLAFHYLIIISLMMRFVHVIEKAKLVYSEGVSSGASVLHVERPMIG